MNKPVLFSVIINAYNYGRFIEEAVESVLRQDFPADRREVIVVDDGSTDDTPQRLAGYEGRIRLIRKESGGQASALNAGFADARGEIAAFLDADDYWYPQKLRRIAREFEKNTGVDAVFHYLDRADPDGVIRSRYPPDAASKDVFFSRSPLRGYLQGRLLFTPPTSGIALRHACAQKIFPIPAELRWADSYLAHMLALYAKECVFIRQPLGVYRIHGENRHYCNHRSGTSADAVRQDIEHIRRLYAHVAAACRARDYDGAGVRRQFTRGVLDRQILWHRLRKETVQELAAIFKAKVYHIAWCLYDPAVL